MILRSYSKIRTELKILNRLISSNNRPEINPQTSAPLLTNLCLSFSSGFRVSSRHKDSLLRSPVTLIPDNSFIFSDVLVLSNSAPYALSSSLNHLAGLTSFTLYFSGRKEITDLRRQKLLSSLKYPNESLLHFMLWNHRSVYSSALKRHKKVYTALKAKLAYLFLLRVDHSKVSPLC